MPANKYPKSTVRLATTALAVFLVLGGFAYYTQQNRSGASLLTQASSSPTGAGPGVPPTNPYITPTASSQPDATSRICNISLSSKFTTAAGQKVTISGTGNWTGNRSGSLTNQEKVTISVVNSRNESSLYGTLTSDQGYAICEAPTDKNAAGIQLRSRGSVVAQGDISYGAAMIDIDAVKDAATGYYKINRIEVVNTYPNSNPIWSFDERNTPAASQVKQTTTVDFRSKTAF